MPSPLSFIKLRDAEYVDQFAGSVVPELKDAQKVLNERYDLAEENDSKRAAIAREMMQNVAKKDEEQARLAYEKAMGDIEANKARGDYENMYGKTANSARQFSVNAAKFIGEKKRIDSYLDQLNKREDISNANKAVLRDMALSKQNALSFDPENNIVLGDGFKEDAFAKDLNVDLWANKMSEGFIPDQTSWNGGKFERVKTGDGGDRLMFVDSKGTKKFVTPTDVERYVSDIAKVDPEMQGYIDRLTKEKLHKLGEDWRNPDPNNYNLVRKEVEGQVLAPTKRAMGNKFGFSQVAMDKNYQFDAIDAYKKKLGLSTPPVYDENARPSVPSTTIQKNFNDANLVDLTKTRTVAEEHSGDDPLYGTVKYKKVPGKSILELAQEKGENSLPLYPGLKMISELFPKKEGSGKVTGTNALGLPQYSKGESEQEYAKRIEPAYKSFLSKINTHQTDQKAFGTESPAYTEMILGPVVDESGKKERAGGAYFTNSPVWIEQNGVTKKFENGNQAIEAKAISKEDLTKFSMTGINNNYGDYGGAYEGAGSIKGSPAKIVVGGGLEHRRYSEPLSISENIINSGEPKTFQTQILGPGGEIPVMLTVEPLKEGYYSINSKGEFDNVKPQITIEYPDGVVETMDYARFKTKLMKNNPYLDPLLNKQRTNQGTEVSKVLPLEDNQ